jgi:hypothetical protein
VATPKVGPQNEKKPARMSSDEKVTILTMSRNQKSIDEIAYAVGRSRTTVQRFLAEMIDTSELAKVTLKAGAVKLAERIIKKAEVREAIDVLSRPDIGVIAPAQKGLPVSGGIQVSVGVSSCGTVVQVTSGGQNATRGEIPAGNEEGAIQVGQKVIEAAKTGST